MTFTPNQLKEILPRNPAVICPEKIWAYDLDGFPYQKLWGCGWEGKLGECIFREYWHREFVAILCPACYDKNFKLGVEVEERDSFYERVNIVPRRLELPKHPPVHHPVRESVIPAVLSKLELEIAQQRIMKLEQGLQQIDSKLALHEHFPSSQREDMQTLIYQIREIIRGVADEDNE